MTDAQGWLERRVAKGTDAIVVAGCLARAAEFAGSKNPSVAMFARHDEDRNCDVWLLSPAAAVYAASLPGAWLQAEEFEQWAWGLVYTAGKGPEAFGLRARHHSHVPGKRRSRSG